MLRSIEDLENYAMQANDGEIGHVRDLFFDDATWAVRYLVVETGSWLAGRKVLISPAALGHSNWGKRILPVQMTREQVSSNPVTYAEEPVARQCKPGFIGYEGYPYQSAGPGSWGMDADAHRTRSASGDFVAMPQGVHHERKKEHRRPTAGSERRSDAHLRSCKAMRSYDIRASDGQLGQVRGILVEEGSWMVRYLVVNTSSWWLGHQVLIAPTWIRAVNWIDGSIRVDLNLKQVHESPPYDSGKALNRQRESGLFEHYGRKTYWAESRTPAPAFAVS